jgi:hypothetical protein
MKRSWRGWRQLQDHPSKPAVDLMEHKLGGCLTARGWGCAQSKQHHRQMISNAACFLRYCCRGSHTAVGQCSEAFRSTT